MSHTSRDPYRGSSGQAYFQQRVHCRAAGAQRDQAMLLAPYIEPHDTVIDFGCGTGGILSAITCGRRIGVEINEPAIEQAIANGLEVVRSLEDLPNDVADVIISHHALEHIDEPLPILRALRDKVRPRGRLILVIPAETPYALRFRRWRPNPQQHLYSWTPLSFGNLVVAAGFDIDKAFIMPGGYSRFIEWSRPIPPLFSMLKRVVAFLDYRYHIIALARRPLDDAKA